MIKTEKHSQLAIGSDGLLKVNIRDLNGEPVDVESYEFRVELYGKKVMKGKLSEKKLSDDGKYIISYNGSERVNNVVKDGELYFIIDKYKLEPLEIYYSQYEFYEQTDVERELQRACHGLLDAKIVYLDSSTIDVQTIEIQPLALKGEKGEKGDKGDTGEVGEKGDTGEKGTVELMSFEIMEGYLYVSTPEESNIEFEINEQGELIALWQ